MQLTLTRLPQPERFAGVSVQLDGRTAVATGSLNNPRDAELLKQLLLLEPGVYEVDVSQVTAAAATGTPSAVLPLESVPARESDR